MNGSARLDQLNEEVWELQKKIRAKYPGFTPQPWPEELQKWQKRLEQLNLEIAREKLSPASAILPMPPDSGPPLPRALGIKWPWRENDD